MRPIAQSLYTAALREFWLYKRDFWNSTRLYEQARYAWDKDWHMANLMSAYRMMKSNLRQAREMAGRQ